MTKPTSLNYQDTCSIPVGVTGEFVLTEGKRWECLIAMFVPRPGAVPDLVRSGLGREWESKNLKPHLTINNYP